VTGGAATSAGYAHPAYARALAELGHPLALARSGGWLLRRDIPGTGRADAMGAYPLFACPDWSALPADLEDLDPELVSLTLVLDPFGAHDERLRAACFPDLRRAFKEHFVADLRLDPQAFVSKDHRRKSRQSLRRLEVERVESASERLDDWVQLYDQLIARHDISGAQAFSRRSFAGQLEVPGIVAYRASDRGETVGMLLWYVREQVASYHLGASSARGYELRSAYALMWSALEDLRSRGARWAHLGGVAGLADDETDGLTRFKRGWSTGTRTAWLCGRIIDRGAYDELTRGLEASDFFPRYRARAPSRASHDG
jgi:hypothetical protein